MALQPDGQQLTIGRGVGVQRGEPRGVRFENFGCRLISISFSSCTSDKVIIESILELSFARDTNLLVADAHVPT